MAAKHITVDLPSLAATALATPHGAAPGHVSLSIMSGPRLRIISSVGSMTIDEARELARVLNEAADRAAAPSSSSQEGTG
jgi:hypothetical protein